MYDTARRDETIHIRGQVGTIVGHLWQWRSSEFCPTEAWAPPINIYRLERRVDLCVDLAGIDPATIDVRAEPGRLVIRGVRPSPEPPRNPQESMRIIAMEIDYGPFCRTVPLPDQVELGRISSEYIKGLLWIRVPLREPA